MSPAITAFLESENFEHAIRLAVSLGGDSDTIAAMAGSIAEAYYDIPQPLIDAVQDYIPAKMKTILQAILTTAHQEK